MVLKLVALSLLLTESLCGRACLRMDLSGEINVKRQNKGGIKMITERHLDQTIPEVRYCHP